MKGRGYLFSRIRERQKASVESFETYRPYLFSIAYRMLGSAVDAEDMVQETYVRYQAAPLETIRSLKGVSHHDHHAPVHGSASVSAEEARRVRGSLATGADPHVRDRPKQTDPETLVERQELISLAFLVLMEQLQPFERAVFLLHEVFVYEFAEIAEMLDKSELACRRSFSRARLHLRAHRPRFPASPQTHGQLLRAYFQAVETGELVP